MPEIAKVFVEILLGLTCLAAGMACGLIALLVIEIYRMLRGRPADD